MRIWSGVVCAVVGLVLFSASRPHKGPASSASSEAAQAPRPAGGKRAPVLVELFTSEGCSSCPLADALLERLDQTQPVEGAQVVALEHHVDYWNQLGWRDPYSSAAASARQSAYAQSFGNDGVYTPQMVVDGRTEFVGSSESRARQAISQAAQSPKTAVHLARAQNRPLGKSDVVPLEVRVEQLGQVTAGDSAEVLLAVTESHLHSDVVRGENAGRKLDHASVVRELKRIGTANLQAAVSFSAEPAVTIANGWKRKNLRAVVFVQESRSRRVLAAAEIGLAAK